jgi:hypothetical protein
MLLVSLLNAIGWICSPFLGKTKYSDPIANFRDFYDGTKQKDDVYIIPTPEPTPSISKTTPPKKTPTVTPEPKPQFRIDPEKENLEKIKNVTAQFIAAAQFAKTSKESIINRVNEISGKVDQIYMYTLEKLKIMDYPLEYSINDCNYKYGEGITSTSGFTIDFSRPTIVSSLAFAPSENKSCACTSFTLTTVSEKEAMSQRVNLKTGVPEVQEEKLALPLSCTKLIFSDIKTQGNSETVCMPYFYVFGPGSVNSK